MSRDISQAPPKTYGKLQTESPLSPDHAFVVQFRSDTTVAYGCYAGRIEHVVSGQAAHFASLEELLAFIGRALATVRAPPRKKVGANAKDYRGAVAMVRQHNYRGLRVKTLLLEKS